MFGTTELIIILVILVLIFGLGKLPKAARQIGQSVRTFQDSVKGEDDEIEVGNVDNGDRAKIENQEASQAARDASIPAQNDTADQPVDKSY